MVRFSCFQAHIPSHRHKKTVGSSGDTIQKRPGDSAPNKNLSSLRTDCTLCLTKEKESPSKVVDSMADYSRAERECRSDELDGKCNSDCDIMVYKNTSIRKSLSLGSVLNWDERSLAADGSEDEIEQRVSYSLSVDRGGLVAADDINFHARALSDKCHEPLPSECVQVGSDFAKTVSIFSIGDPQRIEMETVDKDDIATLSNVDSKPNDRPAIAKSSSLPRIGSPKHSPGFALAHSRSAEDLNTWDFRKTYMRNEAGRQVQCEGRDCLDDKIDAEENNYNCLGSAKDWIVPEADGANMERVMEGEASFQAWDEVATKDFKIKRIEQWVTDLQYTGPVEEADELNDHEELSKPSPANVMPAVEAAKRYISSLNPTATAAQLSNLGLVVIPFLSAFVHLKALNLSGNAIVRIAAGALPRGLHLLNLSKNNVSTIEGLRDLTRLRVLDLSYNRILRIGHGLAGCSSLKELYIAGNKISEVEGLHRLLKLNVLDLRFNKISTTKCLGQLAANYNCLHALSLEGNPAQKNVGDEPLKKYVLSLLPNLTYYNRQSVKVGTMKDGADRSARLGIGSHQIDRGLRVEVKNMRKGTHGSSRRAQGAVAPAKSSRSKQLRPPPSGMRTTTLAHHLPVFKTDFSVHRSRSEGNLGAL